VAKRRLCSRVSKRMMNRLLRTTPANNFACFEETVKRRRNHDRWSKELEIQVEALFREGIHEPIYEMLLQNRGGHASTVGKWAIMLGKRYNIDWCELFSDYQLHMFNMLDGIADKPYNRELSFLNNLYKQLECLTKDKRRYYSAQKRKDDWNCIPPEQMEEVPDKRDWEFLLDLQNLNCSETDKQIILGLATGEIGKQDIPTVLNWENKDDRKKLSRYMKKLTGIITQLD
jgi:hypothetical protein